MTAISNKQRRIYEYIADYIADRGVSPSIREICAALNLSSPSTVHAHLRKLQEAGLIDTGAGKKRAITLAEKPSGSIPILGSVRAGEPILAFEDIDGYLPYASGGGRGEHFALRVRGDSMIEAGIFEGDCVVVRRQPTAESGEIVVALLGDEATVKRLKLRGGHVLLVPENPNYEPIDGDEAIILGKVTALVREY